MTFRHLRSLLTSFLGLMALGVPSCNGSVAEPSSTFTMQSQQISVQEVSLHYLEAGQRDPAKPTVVLLHGGRFSAQTWVELGTIETLAQAGHHVIAFDLPGYGKSEGPQPKDRAAFLAAALQQLKLTPCALLSPSMSGSYSIPLLLEHPEMVSLYLPVAPVGIAANLEALALIDAPTLAFWGENDQVVPLAMGKKLVAAMPQAELRVFAGAPHPCYLQATQEFHQAILEFLAKNQA
jgi:abhydrolase domain-containing protein 14